MPRSPRLQPHSVGQKSDTPTRPDAPTPRLGPTRPDAARADAAKRAARGVQLVVGEGGLGPDAQALQHQRRPVLEVARRSGSWCLFHCGFFPLPVGFFVPLGGVFFACFFFLGGGGQTVTWKTAALGRVPVRWLFCLLFFSRGAPFGAAWGAAVLGGHQFWGLAVLEVVPFG